MLVYGRNVALDLLKKNKNIEKIILQDGFSDENIISMIKNSKIRFTYKSKRELDNLSKGVHQGIILYVSNYKFYPVDKLINNNENKFIVILDHIEDPHNFGAIIRTCESAGVDGIIIPKNRQVQITSTVMKTSVGTLSDVKISCVSNLVNIIKKLKKEGYWIVGSALENSVDYRNVDYSGKIVLVVGNEGEGISRLVRESCDFVVKIPMYGQTNSLNASVAAGIMIYEIIRNRK